MVNHQLTERATDFVNFQKRAGLGVSVFVPAQLAHIYLKLELQSHFENAQNAADARGFFRSVARATAAADSVARRYGGEVLEVQGSMLHVGIPLSTANIDTRIIMGTLHAALKGVFPRAGSRVSGWRMACDSGRTLVVTSPSVHGDSSYVSLGRSANRPARHIYNELELAESERSLKRGYYARWDGQSAAWAHDPLDAIPGILNEFREAAARVSLLEPKVSYVEAITTKRGTLGDAAPIRPGAVNPDAPYTYFGWVMRADLDGFTSRVEECFDDDAKLTVLASGFLSLMQTAASFTLMHNQTLAQLPWAGDNFTAAAVYGSKDEYDSAVPRRLAELALDFEKELAQQAKSAGFGGWAYGVAGGDVHGNAGGNVYIASAEAGGRRFLIGAGEGFGRSAQAFTDTNPRAGTVALYESDVARLEDGYKQVFEPAVTTRDTQSSLFRNARTSALQLQRARLATVGVSTTITVPRRSPVAVSTRPYSK